MPLSTDAVLRLLQDTAAEVITPRFRALAAEDVAEKKPGDYVTVADRESEVRITEALRAAYPEALVVGEEATASDPELPRRLPQAVHAFVVDPVDGTKNFVNGSPDHAVMCAELVDDTPVRAWIWQPEHQRAIVAERGAGVEVNGTRLPVPQPRPVPRGASSTNSLSFDPADVDLTTTHLSCGIDYPFLVEGVFDFLGYTSVHAWDHLPGTLMVREMGGVVRTLDGVEYSTSTTRGPLIAALSEDVWRLAASRARG